MFGMSKISTVRRIRQERGIPMYVVARKARTAVQTLWLWELHEIVPNPAVVKRVAQVLGVQPQDLIEAGGDTDTVQG